MIGHAKKGYPPAGVIPLGYRYIKHNGKGGHYDIAPEEALLVQDIFRWYVQDGQSMHAIAVRLIRGAYPRRGNGVGKAHNARAPWGDGMS